MTEIIHNKKDSKKGKRGLLLLLLLLLLFVVGLILYFLFFKQPPQPQTVITWDTTTIQVDTVIDTIPQHIEKPEEPVITIKKPDLTKEDTVQQIQDTVPVAQSDSMVADTLVLAEDTLETIINPCDKDTVPLWVYPDPAGGLHIGAVEVKLFATKDATIEWRFSDESQWRPYVGRGIVIDVSKSLCITGTDTCGRKIEPRCIDYEIAKKPDADRCPDDMTFIKVGPTGFCIDKYEWPNRKGIRPSANVSKFQAEDSCFVKGKRLCSASEWSIACSGPQSTRYPYGNRYIPAACNTRDSVAYRAGTKPECRGYFEVFDMSGNLAEWTDTRSKNDPDFFTVMGGFWQSGPQGDCVTPRYSYYPQNHHNPVGFRCCKDNE